MKETSFFGPPASLTRRVPREFARAWVLCLSAYVLFVAGCGDGRRATYPVTGTVKFADGTPLAGGTVEFESSDPTAEHLNARGEIQADGAYRLTTYAEGDGAIAGEQRVIVHAPQPPDSGNMSGPPPKSVLHPRYRGFDTSGLTFTVQPGENTFPITVERP